MSRKLFELCKTRREKNERILFGQRMKFCFYDQRIYLTTEKRIARIYGFCWSVMESGLFFRILAIKLWSGEMVEKYESTPITVQHSHRNIFVKNPVNRIINIHHQTLLVHFITFSLSARCMMKMNISNGLMSIHLARSCINFL
jgi:hypothetical protein